MSVTSRAQLIEQIRGGKDILSMPQVLAELLREVNNPNFGSEALSRLIMQDPGLTTRILRLANSSYYQRFARTTSVQQAVQVLGLTTVKCLALSAAIFNPERTAIGGLQSKELFANILSIAAVTETIARRVGHKSTDEAFLAGLLHQIGLMFLLQNYPKEYQQVVNQETGEVRMLDAEQKVFGMHRYEIGAEIADAWHLPAFVHEAIRDLVPQQTEPTPGKLSLYLALASLLNADPLNHYPVDLEERASRITRLAKACGLSHEDITSVLESRSTATTHAAEILDIDVGTNEEILARANREIWRTYLIVENLFKDRQELSKKLLEEERIKGALEQKAVTISTLSHYVNNATMGIYGRSQILRMLLKKGDASAIAGKLPPSLDSIDNAIKKIVAVLAEIRDLAPLDHTNFIHASSALNIDARIEQRMQQLDHESGLELPEEAQA